MEYTYNDFIFYVLVAITGTLGAALIIYLFKSIISSTLKGVLWIRNLSSDVKESKEILEDQGKRIEELERSFEEAFGGK